MSITIKSLFGEILYVSDSSSVRVALEEAVAASADLRYANLRYADLGSADLRSANLRYANLGYADLWSADLRSANLRYADLRYADLWSADLGSADLRSADLRYANLGYAENIPDHASSALTVAAEGSIVGWKKARNGKIVKLRIPKDAKRSSATSRKCRASKAKVLAIFNPNGAPELEAHSSHNPDFRYVVGETITPELPFDEDRWKECASGIHFFITREEAEDY